MKPTKKQLKEIQEIEKKVAEVCDTKKVEVTLDDKGVIINKETGNPHFEPIDIDEMKKLVEEKKSRDVSVGLSFGRTAPSLKFQLKKQGFKLPKNTIQNAEYVRADLLELRKINILSKKQLIKCFKRLSMQISKKIVDSLVKEGEIALHKETIYNK